VIDTRDVVEFVVLEPTYGDTIDIYVQEHGVKTVDVTMSFWAGGSTCADVTVGYSLHRVCQPGGQVIELP